MAKPRVATHPHGVNVDCRRSRSGRSHTAFAGTLNVLRLVLRLNVPALLNECGIRQAGYGAPTLLSAYLLRALGIGISSAQQLAKRLQEDPIGELVVGQPDRSTVDRFIRRRRFSWREVMRRLCCRIVAHRPKGDGVLALDDTHLERTGRKIEGCRKLYDPSTKRYIWGHNPVGAVYTTGGWSVPFDVAFPECTPGKTKHDVALEMVEAAVRLGLETQWVVFDSWYFHALNFVKAIAALKLGWVSRTKSDRIFVVNGERVSAADVAERAKGRTWRRDATSREVHYQTVRATLPEYGPVTLVVLKEPDEDDSPVVLVSSDPKARGHRVIHLYKLRWGIETVWRTGKQRMGLGKCHHRPLHANESHAAMVLMAYALAEQIRVGLPPEVAAETLGEVIDEVIVAPARIHRNGDAVSLLFECNPELAPVIAQLENRLPGRKRRSDSAA